MSEDIQPNEVRLSRKGSTSVPRVRTTRPLHAPYGGHSRSISSHDSRLSKRTRCQLPPASHPPLPALSNSRTVKTHQEPVNVHLPPECYKGAPGCHSARKRWIQDQKRYLWTNRHLSVVSFKYLEHDRSVLFTCRTRQADQYTGHDARDNIGTGTQLVNAPLNKDSIGIVQPVCGHSAPSQSSEPGSSRVKHIPRTIVKPEDCLQHADSQASGMASCYSAEKRPVQSSTMVIESYHMQTVHSNPTPRREDVVHMAPSTERIIDLTLDSPDLVTEVNAPRWSTFRSGCTNACLPLSGSDLVISSLEASTGPQPRINQPPPQIEGCHDVVCSRATSTTLAPSNLRVHDTIQVHPVEGRQIGGSISGQSWQCDGPKAASSSYLHDYAVVPEDQEVPSTSDCSSLTRSLTSTCSNLVLSLGPHDKPRRVLHLDGFTYIVTAHGIIDQVDARGMLRWGCNIRSPSLPYEELVDDACILLHQRGPIVILCHAREQNQIALLNLDHGQVSRHIMLRRDWNRMRRPGASAITWLMSPLKFASGGYDHRVHIWDITQDLSGASAVELAIKHTSLVSSLLPIADTSHKLVSVGADRGVHIYDMSAEHVLHTLKTSCTPYHAHRTDSVFCFLLEVAHLETQFELRDRRVRNQTVQRFGFVTEERRGRYEKAGTWSNFVACGDKNGVVRLWDLRNASTEVAHQQCFDDPVVQVIKAGPRLLVCSKRNELTCIDFSGRVE